MLNSLIFVQRLTAHKYADIRSCILTKLEQGRNLSLQAVEEECQRIIYLRYDTNKNKEQDCSHFKMCRLVMNREIE